MPTEQASMLESDSFIEYSSACVVHFDKLFLVVELFTENVFTYSFDHLILLWSIRSAALFQTSWEISLERRHSFCRDFNKGVVYVSKKKTSF